MSASLGGLIKDFRLQKGISQFDIAFAMGWKEPSRLSRIEQGKVVKPPRDMIDRLCNAMQLNQVEKNNLLLVGNYLPTDEEIVAIRKELEPVLSNWPYPANVLDFSWRLIDRNKSNRVLYSDYKGITNFDVIIDQKHPRILEVIFDPDFPENKLLINNEQISAWHVFLKSIVTQFKYEQRNRTNEKWYIEHIKSMMNNQLFRRIWTETSESTVKIETLGKYATKKLIKPGTKDQILTFYLFVTPVINDPRFEMEMLVPADLESYKFFQKK